MINNSRFINWILLSVVFFFYSGCIQEADVPIGENQRILVVEGGVSTVPKSHLISIARTANYAGILDGGEVIKETGATVVVRDSEGNSIFFEEGEVEGNYYSPPEFAAEIGKSYTLLIQTSDGEVFNSIPQTVEATPAIDALVPVFVTKTDPVTQFDVYGLEVYSSFKDSEERDYYLWSTRGVYSISARPDLHTDALGNPTPKDCCATCWVSENRISEFRTVNDELFNGDQRNEIVAFIEDDGHRFDSKYYLKVEQSKIPSEAYEFYKILNQLAEIDGDIFDPPPVTSRGNIINIDDPDQNIIGYFYALDVIEEEIFLLPSMLDERAPDIILNDDCRVYKNGFTDRPAFW